MKIQYYDRAMTRYLTLDPDSGSAEEMQAPTATPDIDGLPAEKFHTDEDGRFEYYCAFRYTLRDDMERKIRRRFYRRDTVSGEIQEMFTHWDRSMFQPNNYCFLRPGLFFTIASITETGENAAYFVDVEHDFDGVHPRMLWKTHAYPYSFHMSPDKKMLSYHLAGFDPDFNPRGHYAINLMDMRGERRLVCSEAGHLFFGPHWSPDGAWLVFQDCIPDRDPGHHFSDIAVCRPDGSEFHRLTEHTSCYFGTSFGLEGYRMGGSNFPIWTPDSRLIFSPMMEDSHPDCHFDASQRNHEELIYDPSMGRGGCNLSLMNPEDGTVTALTEMREGHWDFRPHLSGDGEWLLYTHSSFGCASEVRLMHLPTGEIRTVTSGTDGLGADHARFV